MKEGLRFNEGKLRYDLLHPKALEGITRVLTKGAIKYAPKNWEIGMSWSSVIASLKRHLQAIENGEDIDSETGERHIDHLQCNAHFLSAYYSIAPQFDDRVQWFKKPLKKVWLDIDGILAGFEEGYLQWFNLENQDHPNDWHDHRFTNLDEIKDLEEFWMSLPALIKPEELTYPIAGYCTTRGCNNDITRKWLNLHKFPNVPIINVGKEPKSVALIEQKCDYFIDDSIYNFMECQEQSKYLTTYLMSRPHNAKFDVQSYRVDNIQEFLNKII